MTRWGGGVRRSPLRCPLSGNPGESRMGEGVVWGLVGLGALRQRSIRSLVSGKEHQSARGCGGGSSPQAPADTVSLE